MITSFENNRHQWFKEINALAIVIQPTHLCPRQELTGNWDYIQLLQKINFNESNPLIMASGQHHIAALKKMSKRFVQEQDSLSARLECL
jgi:hypothetical protein